MVEPVNASKMESNTIQNTSQIKRQAPPAQHRRPAPEPGIGTEPMQAMGAKTMPKIEGKQHEKYRAYVHASYRINQKVLLAYARPIWKAPGVVL
jgi:hypothetical protein